MQTGHPRPATDQVATILKFSPLLTGFWNRMEMYCRELTKRWDEVHVVSGPTSRPIAETDYETQEERTYIKYRVSLQFWLKMKIVNIVWLQRLLQVMARSFRFVHDYCRLLEIKKWLSLRICTK